MTSFLDALETPTPHQGPGPGPFGRLVLLFLWAVLGVLCLLSAVGDLKVATGVVGIPGTLTVQQCVDLDEPGEENSGRYDCDGVFTPDGGGPLIAVDASPDSSAGDVTHARLVPGEDRAVRDGTVGVLAAMTLPWLGVAILAFVPWALRWALTGIAGRRFVVSGCVATVVALVGVVVGLVAS